MKFKGLTKLAMSGVALAAVAATLGTSTYAWYVTNSTATASNIIANTQATSSSNLLISKDGTNFSSKFAFTAADFNGGEAGGYAAALHALILCQADISHGGRPECLQIL